MMEISRRQRDFHIPTTSTTVLCDPKTKAKNGHWGPWKSGNPKAGFPLFHRPGRLRRMVDCSPRRQRGAAVKCIDPGLFLLRVRFAAHHWALWRHPDRILDRQGDLVEAAVFHADTGPLRHQRTSKLR